MVWFVGAGGGGMTSVAHTVMHRHTAAADGVCFRGTSVVPGDAVQLEGCRFENGEGAPALAVVAGSAGALGPHWKLAGVGCVDSPRKPQRQKACN